MIQFHSHETLAKQNFRRLFTSKLRPADSKQVSCARDFGACATPSSGGSKINSPNGSSGGKLFTLGLQISFVAQTKQTFLLLRNVVRVARALPALIFRSFRIAARLTRAVIVLQLRFIGHEERLA